MPDPPANSSQPSADAPKPAARTVGGYEIEGELGRGGMGVVYLARQIELNRRVALKMLTGHYGPHELRRFLEEAETAAGLSHSNIAQIYEVGEHEGAPYFSMEYVENGSLADRLRKGLPSPEDTARLLIEVARALHHAHQNHVVHRDMKPANVLLDQDGVPKIADFGIAKRLEDSSNLTVSGAVIGTPTYMAPEQAKGTSRHVGPAADVYSLGAILYEMLAGRPPFLPDDSETAITVRVLTEEPVSPAWHRPEIPRDLETICMKCLEKQPRDRYTSAAALAEDLRRFLDDESILAKPPSTVGRSVKWVRRHPWKFIAATLALLVIVAGLFRLAQWLIYERPRTEYASTVRMLRGGMEPDVLLTAAEAARRDVSFRITRKGWRGPIVRVEVLNPRGHPAVVRQLFNYDALPNWLEGLAGMQKEALPSRETSAIDLTVSGGEVVEATAADRNQNINWRMRYEHPGTRGSQNLVQARFTDLRGNDIGLTDRPSRVELERDANGRDVRARFYDSAGQPQPNAEGVYGYRLEWEANGRMSRVINLNQDGNVGKNFGDIGGLVLSYGPRGQISRVSYLGLDEKPALFFQVASMTLEYDDVGNLMHIRFLDANERLVNALRGDAATDYTRNEHGEPTQIVRSRVSPDGSLTEVSRMTIEYDANGYPSAVRSFGAVTRTLYVYDQVGNITEERRVDAEGKPITGAEGWSMRRKVYRQTQNPFGWREEETYFDVNGARTFHQDGYHRTISEFDELGQRRLIINEDYDPKFGYYRYVSKFDFVGGKLRRLVSRFEDENGQLTSKAATCASFDSTYDEDEDELTKWETGCNVQVIGAPAFRTDTEYPDTGTKRVRQALDENRQPLAVASNGIATRIEETYDDDNHPERVYETGFNERVVGFSSREAKFLDGNLQSVTRKRADGSTVASVNVFIVRISSNQPQAAKLQLGDQLVSVNGKPMTSAYAWAAGKFPGGSVDVMRESRLIHIDGFSPGMLGVSLEERAKK